MPCIHLRRVIDGSSREMLAELDLSLDETAPERLANKKLSRNGLLGSDDLGFRVVSDPGVDFQQQPAIATCFAASSPQLADQIAHTFPLGTRVSVRRRPV